VEDISRNYIGLRYRLIPYLYSLFYHSHINGIPVARTLAIDYTFDEEIYRPGYQNQYLFGPSILVAPVESYKEITKVYLPEGLWYNFHTEEIYQGPKHIYVDSPVTHLPLFIKAGGIIPMQSLIQTTRQLPEPVLKLHIYGGQDGQFHYYEDDGFSYQYENEIHYQRIISFDQQKGELVIGTVTGSFVSKFTQLKCYLHGFNGINVAEISGGKVKLDEEEVMFLPPVSNFDPLGKESVSFPVNVKTFTIENSDKEQKIRFR
jgi:alpha-glucosidase